MSILEIPLGWLRSKLTPNVKAAYNERFTFMVQTRKNDESVEWCTLTDTEWHQAEGAGAFQKVVDMLGAQGYDAEIRVFIAADEASATRDAMIASFKPVKIEPWKEWHDVV